MGQNISNLGGAVPQHVIRTVARDTGGQVYQKLEPYLQKLGKKENLAAILATGATIVVIQGVVLALGFGVLGPVAGTLAPAIQSSFYGAAVPAGSLFAILQAAGMTGTLTAVASALTCVAAPVAGFVARAWVKKKETEESE